MRAQWTQAVASVRSAQASVRVGFRPNTWELAQQCSCFRTERLKSANSHRDGGGAGVVVAKPFCVGFACWSMAHGTCEPHWSVVHAGHVRLW